MVIGRTAPGNARPKTFEWASYAPPPAARAAGAIGPEAREDLIKLRNWFAKIKDRDVFGAPGRQACADCLEVCERALETYAAWVYVGESDNV